MCSGGARQLDDVEYHLTEMIKAVMERKRLSVCDYRYVFCGTVKNVTKANASTPTLTHFLSNLSCVLVNS